MILRFFNYYYHIDIFILSLQYIFWYERTLNILIVILDIVVFQVNKVYS